jgi:hypothetical protein
MAQSTHTQQTYAGEPGAIVSTVRVMRGPAHDLVQVWNRGGFSGSLTVKSGDGEALARRLIMPEVESR